MRSEHFRAKLRARCNESTTLGEANPYSSKCMPSLQPGAYSAKCSLLRKHRRAKVVLWLQRGQHFGARAFQHLLQAQQACTSRRGANAFCGVREANAFCGVREANAVCGVREANSAKCTCFRRLDTGLTTPMKQVHFAEHAYNRCFQCFSHCVCGVSASLLQTASGCSESNTLGRGKSLHSKMHLFQAQHVWKIRSEANAFC